MPSDSDLRIVERKIDDGDLYAEFKDGALHFMHDSRGKLMPVYETFRLKLMADVERGALKLKHSAGGTYQVTR